MKSEKGKKIFSLETGWYTSVNIDVSYLSLHQKVPDPLETRRFL
jgi:hypothetical protein